jgi:thioredoxin-related protein
LRSSSEAAPAAGRTGIVPAVLNAPIVSQLEPGRVTVFVFSGRWCPACRRLERNIKRFAGVRPDVAFKFLESNDRWRAQYNIHTVPHVVMFDANGKQIAADSGSDKSAYELLYRWMGEESQRVHREKRG